MSRQEFLSAALRRLESGHVALTEMRGDDLVAIGWVATGDRPVSLAGYDRPLVLSPGTALLYDVRLDFGHLNGDAAGILVAMVAAAAHGETTRRVVVALPGRSNPLARVLEQLGLRRTGTIVRASRLGGVSLWSSGSSKDVTLAPESAPAMLPGAGHSAPPAPPPAAQPAAPPAPPSRRPTRTPAGAGRAGAA